MAQSGYTPILIYASGTAAALPSAANLTSSANGAELALNYADGKLYYKNSAGTVTLLADKISVSVASANGFSGSVSQATATSTPAITLSTSVTGVLVGNGTAVAAAVSGTDFKTINSTSILGSGNISITTSPGGSTTQVQYNNAGAFGGSANFVFDGTNVGIGTSSPSSFYAGARKLVVGGASGEQGLTIYSGDNFGYLLFATGTSGTNPYSGQVRYDQPTLSMAVVNFQNGPLQFLTNNTERMRIDSAGMLGLGLTPSSWYTGGPKYFQLTGDVGFAATTNNSIRFNNYVNTTPADVYYGNGYAGRYTFFANSGQHVWYTAPSGTAGNPITFTQAMTLNSSGNLGIGTSSPAVRLHVYGSNPGFRVEGDAGSYYPEIRLDGANGTMFLTTYYGSMISATNATGNSTIRFRTGGTTSAGAYGGSERMIIDSTGVVYINTSTATLNGLTSQLAISATNSTSSPNAALNIRRSYDVHPGQTSNYYGVYSNISGSTQSSTFTTAGVYGEASIDNGNGVIGKSGTTTSNAYGVTGWASVDSNGYGNAFALRAYLSQTGPNPGNGNLYGLFIDLPNYEGNGSVRTIGVYYKSDYTGSQTTYAMYFVRNSNNIGSISTSTTATAYNTSSDYRMKENVQPMTNALATVAQLNPVTYTWKSTGEAGQGFIAHELQAVVPHAVTGEKDAVKTERVEVSPAVSATYDEEGNELTPAVEAVFEDREVPVYQGVDTSFLVATLTAAIQELKAIVDAQAARIAALEGN